MVANGSLTLMKGIIKNDLYTLIGKKVIDKSFAVQSINEDLVKLWYMRFGHINPRKLQELDKQGLIGKKNLWSYHSMNTTFLVRQHVLALELQYIILNTAWIIFTQICWHLQE